MGEIYFDVTDFPEAKNEYVLWVDIMGTKNSMSSSVKTSSIFICKLHAGIMKSKNKNINVYPMMDGAYITSERADEMDSFIRKLFTSLSDTLIAEKSDVHRFLVKGAIAYGPITHGKDIPSSCSKCLEKNPNYVQNILLGMPMIQANEGEKYAPPFGIYCDKSARMASPVFAHRWHDWFAKSRAPKVSRAVQSYFDYALEHFYELNYPKEKIYEHAEMAKQYFRP